MSSDRDNSRESHASSEYLCSDRVGRMRPARGDVGAESAGVGAAGGRTSVDASERIGRGGWFGDRSGGVVGSAVIGSGTAVGARRTDHLRIGEKPGDAAGV